MAKKVIFYSITVLKNMKGLQDPDPKLGNMGQFIHVYMYAATLHAVQVAKSYLKW